MMQIRIRLDRISFSYLDPFLSIPGSGSVFVSYSNEHKKNNWRENLTKYAFWFGPDGPTDKENSVKMCEKYWYHFR